MGLMIAKGILKIKDFFDRFMMMIITWHGGGCYRVETPDFNLIIDPDTSSKAGRLKADLVLRTSSRAPFTAGENEIVGPGEYEIGRAKVRGVALPSENSNEIRTAYRVLLQDIRLGFFGGKEFSPSEEILESLDGIDILFIFDGKAAPELVKIIEPRIVIPNSEEVKKIEAMFGQKTEPREKLVLKKKDLSEKEGIDIVILKS